MLEVVTAGHWTLPLDHLSPSSLGMLIRCPFQFQRRYIHGEKERPGEALVVGSAVHLGLELNFAQKIESFLDLPAAELQEWMQDAGFPRTVAEQQERAGMEIVWDAGLDAARQRSVNMALAYHREVAPRLQPVTVEGWVEADFGLPVKVIGRFDLSTTERRTIDYKTGSRAQL